MWAQSEWETNFCLFIINQYRTLAFFRKGLRNSLFFDNHKKLFSFGKLEFPGEARGFFLRIELGEWACIRNKFCFFLFCAWLSEMC